MAITSYGYTGTVMPNEPWARMQAVLASDYMVQDQTSCAVSPVGAGTREVRVATGVIGGRGIRDEITEAETVQLPTVASGTRYFVIVARRTWQAEQATTLTYVAAGESMPGSLPRDLESEPGVIDDQPLALVSLAAGNTVPSLIYDLRCIGGPTEYAITEDVPQGLLAYMARVGVVIRYGSQIRRRVLSPASGVPIWQTSPQLLTGSQVITELSGNGFSLFSGGQSLAWVDHERGTCDLRIEARRNAAGNITTDGSGGVGDISIGQLAPAVRPRLNQTVDGVYLGGGGATYGCTLTIGTGGYVRLISMAPNTTMPAQPTGTVSLWATDFYGI